MIAHLERSFARMGARIKLGKVAEPGRFGPRSMRGFVSLDVRADRDGEVFIVRLDPEADAELSVMDVRPAERHLLLLAKRHNGRAVEKSKARASTSPASTPPMAI